MQALVAEQGQLTMQVSMLVVSRRIVKGDMVPEKSALTTVPSSGAYADNVAQQPAQKTTD